MTKNVIFDKKNVLVTGGAGFIGSHLCDELIKTCKVICLDNFSTGSEKNIDHLLSDPNFEFVRHDMSEVINLEKLPELQKFKIEFQGIQEIYHLACPTSPKFFTKNKVANLMANSYAVKNSLDLAVKHRSKFLLLSSSVIYGYNRPQSERIKEEDIGAVDTLSERSSYDEGKRFAETITKTYRDAYGLDTKIIRLFRTYGPRMMLNEGHMLPDFISCALDNRDLTIYGGKDFTSSFCYVNDAIDSILKIMSTELSGPYNIGSDVPINLTDLASIILKKIGSSANIKYEKQLLFMSPLSLPDISRARNELGWLPVISLDKGLDLTIYEIRAAKGLKSVGR